MLESIPEGETEDEFLDSLPNPENTIEPNLMLVKMKWIGIPRSAAFVYAIFALAFSALGLAGIKKTIATESAET